MGAGAGLGWADFQVFLVGGRVVFETWCLLVGGGGASGGTYYASTYGMRS